MPRRSRRTTPRGAPVVAAVVFAGALLASADATAQALRLTSRTVYHGYQIPLQPETDPNGPERDVNRFYQTLNVGGYHLLEGDIDVVMSLRYDTDFGTGFHRDTPPMSGIVAVDGRDDLDLMYAYVEWRNLWKRRLDGRFGRQVIVDDLQWYSLDGVNLTFHPWYDGDDRLDVDMYVGVPVQFDLLFSSEPFVADGTEVDDSATFPGIAFGGSARLQLMRDLELSVSYRQELEFRKDDLAAFRGLTEAASRSGGSRGVVESRLGASAGYTIRPIDVSVYGSVIWDTFLGVIEQARGGAAWNPTRGLHVQGEYLRVQPTFRGDSIFNWFNLFPYDRGRFEVTAELYPGLTVQGGYLVQLFQGDDEVVEFTGLDITHGPSLGATYRHDRFTIGMYGEVADSFQRTPAYGGNYAMAWIYGDVGFWSRRLVADARVTVTSFESDWFAGANAGENPDRETSLLLALGARGRILSWMTARLLFVRNFNAYLEGSYRVFSELALRY